MNIPEGWKLVPERPTSKMIVAFNDAGGHYNKGGTSFATFSERYDAMLAAAPAPPETQP